MGSVVRKRRHGDAVNVEAAMSVDVPFANRLRAAPRR